MVRLNCFGVTAILLMSWLATGLHAEERFWRDKAGKPLMTGNFHSFPDDLVWIVKTDGSRASIPWKQLSEGDRKFVMYSVLGLDMPEQTAEVDKTPAIEALPEPEVKQVVPPVAAAVEAKEKVEEAVNDVAVAKVAESPPPKAKVAAPEPASAPQSTRVAARPNLNEPLLVAPAEPIAKKTRTLYCGRASRTSIDPLKVVSAEGPEPELFLYFTAESGHPEIKKWALGRKVEHGNLYAVWYERAGYWYFFDWTTKQVVSAK